MLAADLAVAMAAGVAADPRLARLAERFFPGPLTLVCRAVDGGSVGLRIPRHPFMRALLRELGGGVAATSANRSGEPPAGDAAAAVAGLAGEPDLLVDGGPVQDAQPSTVASLLEGGLRILRPGPVTEAELAAALAEAPGGEA
jgi:L-threonylcarbamoyladenylate synthase